MTILKYVLALTLALSSSFAWSEPTIYIRSDGQFVAGGNEYPRGFWIPEIKNAETVFSVHPEAAAAYEMHKKRALWFTVLNWGAVGVAATYAVASGDDFDSGTFWTLFLIPWIGGLFCAASSNRHLFKAINIVNGVPADKAHWLPPTQNPFQLTKNEFTLPVFGLSF